MKQWIVAGLIHFDSIEPMKQHVQKNGFDFNEIVCEKKIYIKSVNGNIPIMYAASSSCGEIMEEENGMVMM